MVILNGFFNVSKSLHETCLIFEAFYKPLKTPVAEKYLNINEILAINFIAIFKIANQINIILWSL